MTLLTPDVADFDGPYRYSLTRELGGERTVLWILLNPSTATAEKNDPTVRRCVGFTRAWQFGRLVVCNLYAFRATRPAVMWQARRDGIDIIGAKNDEVIAREARAASRVVVAWGSHAEGDRGLRVLRMLRSLERVPFALGFTAGGRPRHPLYVKGDTLPEPMT